MRKHKPGRKISPEHRRMIDTYLEQHYENNLESIVEIARRFDVSGSHIERSVSRLGLMRYEGRSHGNANSVWRETDRQVREANGYLKQWKPPR